ncbi:hypothetical protein [Leifsonia aquatica]|uniref:hypothetical protein n=1 Tax=Leifsonia aquatica TaxID=144185 RepID=UPI0004694CBD|nr:hypothetical protein [Leifsonia aquatica]
MEGPRTIRTLLVPGFGLVTCVTVATVTASGDSLYTTLLSAVDEYERPVDPRVRARVERVLGAG